MELLKKPIARVPLVLAALGILERILTSVIAFFWVQIQRVQGPNPETGAYEISGGYVTEIMAIISFLLFWAAGWKFVRGLARKQIFFSATIMVVWHAVLLALEQWTMAASNWDLYMSVVYRLWATLGGTDWTTQLLVRVFGEVSVPVALPAIFTPYLYILLGRKGLPQIEESLPEIIPES